MTRLSLIIAAPIVLALGGCVTDGYGYGGVGLAYGDAYPYDGWYDGYYGPLHDGYWGNNGYFYYRSNAGDRRFRRGDRAHFYRGPNAPGANFRGMRGDYRPSRGEHAPHYPPGGRHHRGR